MIVFEAVLFGDTSSLSWSPLSTRSSTSELELGLSTFQSNENHQSSTTPPPASPDWMWPYIRESWDVDTDFCRLKFLNLKVSLKSVGCCCWHKSRFSLERNFRFWVCLRFAIFFSNWVLLRVLRPASLSVMDLFKMQPLSPVRLLERDLLRLLLLMLDDWFEFTVPRLFALSSKLPFLESFFWW